MSRILVVDDDDKFRHAIVKTLGEEGYEVVAARDFRRGPISIEEFRNVGP